MTASAPAAEAGFLGQGEQARFYLYHAPAGAPRGGWLYLHPFAEEMNKARRMAALQARALAEQGYAVLQLDLHGCGDSAGDFGDARWDSWHADVERGREWLAQRLNGAPCGIWGLRLGALLALDHAAHAALPPAALMLWQPVMQGALHLNQFLRLKVAAQMLGSAGPGGGTSELRATLTSGTPLEIAGYMLAPELLLEIDAVDAARLPPPPCPVHWLEVSSQPEAALSPAAQRQVTRWQATGVTVHAQAVHGPAFWASQEITECPALLKASLPTLPEAAHAA